MRSIAGLLVAVASCIANAQARYNWTDVTPGNGITFVATHPLDARKLIGLSNRVVVVSDDRGATWTAVDAPANSANFSTTRLFVHPGLPDTVYLSIGASDGNVRLGTFPASNELHRSRDFGRTWTRLSSVPFSNDSFVPFAADPTDVSGLYAMRIARSAACGIAVPGCIIFRTTAISRSPHEGMSWNASAALPFADLQGFGWPSGPTPSAPERLFISALNESGSFVSHDRGASWSKLPSVQSKNLVAVYPDPLHRNVLYGVRALFTNAASVNGSIVSYYPVLRSDDEGATWKDIGSLYGSLPFLQMPAPVVIDPARSQIIWLAESNQIRRSDDRGETWQVVTPPAAPQGFVPGGLVTSASDAGVIYLLQGARLYRGDPSVRPDPVVTEFHYDPDRYWVAVTQGEAVSQDYRQQPGSVRRTNIIWGAWRADDAPAGAVGSCRFWPQPHIGRSRVIVQQGPDCQALRRDPGWILEAENEFFTLRPVNNACPANTIPVRRFLNLQPDFNHRWVVDDDTEARMQALGWYPEGVRFCSRPLVKGEQ